MTLWVLRWYSVSNGMSNEWEAIGWMRFDMGNWSNGGKTCHSATSSTIDPTWTVLGLNWAAMVGSWLVCIVFSSSRYYGDSLRWFQSSSCTTAAAATAAYISSSIWITKISYMLTMCLNCINLKHDVPFCSFQWSSRTSCHISSIRSYIWKTSDWKVLVREWCRPHQWQGTFSWYAHWC